MFFCGKREIYLLQERLKITRILGRILEITEKTNSRITLVAELISSHSIIIKSHRFLHQPFKVLESMLDIKQGYEPSHSGEESQGRRKHASQICGARHFEGRFCLRKRGHFPKIKGHFFAYCKILELIVPLVPPPPRFLRL